MDILRKENKIISDIDAVLTGQDIDDQIFDKETKDILRFVKKVKIERGTVEIPKKFEKSLRKKLISEFQYIKKSGYQAYGSKKGEEEVGKILQEKKIRFRWAYAVVAVVVLLVAFTSFAAASPGFYEKFVPKPFKKMLSNVSIVQTGRISVNSDPAEANVYFNDKLIGKTPIDLTDIRAGKHKVKIEKEGYKVFEGNVEVHANKTASVEAVLERVKEETVSEEKVVPKEISSKGAVYVKDGDEIGLLKSSGENTLLKTLNSKGSLFKISKSGNIYYFSSNDNKVKLIDNTGKGTDLLSLASGESVIGIELMQEGNDFAIQVKKSADNTVDFRQVNFKDKEASTFLSYSLNESDSAYPIYYNSQGLYYVDYAREDGKLMNKVYLVSTDGKREEIGVLNELVSKAKFNPERLEILAVSKGADGKNYLESFDLKKKELKEIAQFGAEKVKAFDWLGEKVAYVFSSKLYVKSLSGGEAKEILSLDEGFNNSVSLDERSIALQSDSKLKFVNVENGSMNESEFYPEASIIGVISPESLNYETQNDQKETDFLKKETEFKTEVSGSLTLISKGSYVYRLSSDGKLVEIYEIKGVNLNLVGAISDSSYLAGKIPDTDESSNYLYVANGFFSIIDANNPSSPSVIFSDKNIAAEQIAVSGNHAYVGAGDSLYIFDVSNPRDAKVLSQTIFSNGFRDMKVYKNKLAVSSGQNGFSVIDVSNPEKPMVSFNEESKISTSGLVMGDNGRVFVIRDKGYIDVFNLDGEKTENIKKIEQEAERNSIYSGGRIYSAFSEFKILDVSNLDDVKVLYNVKADGDPAETIAIAGDKIIVGQKNKLVVYSLK